MTDSCFNEGIGPVFYMRAQGGRQALRVSLAEMRLTVYCRRLVSDLYIIFHFIFAFSLGWQIYSGFKYSFYMNYICNNSVVK